LSLIVRNITHRTEMVLGGEALRMLQASRVIVFGVGGVGSWCAEALVRTGVTDITIVDSDIICATNINRQLQATSLNVGKVKVEELAARLRSLNPEARITAVNKAFEAESWEDFGLGDFDFVIDAIDSMQNKALLIEKTQAAAAAKPGHGPVLFSSMGAAAKLDPTRVRVARLDQTHVCPLARHIRKMLRDRSVPADFLCVYSDELPIDPQARSLCGTDSCTCTLDRRAHNRQAGEDGQASDWCAKKKRINGSLVHITGVFGFMLAGLVVQETRKRALAVKNPEAAT
jgi:tRNA A37 threonylcarbamoyladenosine dehydratase